jgi:hypothetical protein
MTQPAHKVGAARRYAEADDFDVRIARPPMALSTAVKIAGLRRVPLAALE